MRTEDYFEMKLRYIRILAVTEIGKLLVMSIALAILVDHLS